MTQDEKSILLKDLCARLPYGVQVLADVYKTFDGGIIGKVVAINLESELVYLEGVLTPFSINEIKPYLRPILSMTEEERNEIQGIIGKDVEIFDDFINIIDSSRKRFSFLELQAVFDWLNTHHFDYRGLIDRGLALPAPEGMYNLKKE